jgi:hypothetical protein
MTPIIRVYPAHREPLMWRLCDWLGRVVERIDAWLDAGQRRGEK